MKKLFSFLFLFFTGAGVFADGIMKVMDLPYSYLHLKNVDVLIRIDYQVATVITRQTFVNDYGEDVKLKYGFPLDANSSVNNFIWFTHGDWYQGTIVNRPQDTTAVNPGGEIDQLFLDYLGESPFLMSFRDNLGKDSTILVELTYLQLLEFDSSKIYLRYPLSSGELNTGRLDSMRIQIEILKTMPLLNIHSPVYNKFSLAENDSSFFLTIKEYNFQPQKDVLIDFQIETDSLGVVLYSHQPVNEYGYFLLLTAPPAPIATSEQKLYFDIFAIDISGSMAGDKFELAKTVVNYGIQNLTVNDKFVVIAFNSNFYQYNSQASNATNQVKSGATAFLDELAPCGKTDLVSALNVAFEIPENNNYSKSIILVTDGQTRQNFIELINHKDIPVFVWGIGPAPNSALLNYLVTEFGGLSVYPRQDNCDRCLKSFYKKIRYPFLSDIQIKIQNQVTSEVYPVNFPDLYSGDQLVIAGRYPTPGAIGINISGYQNQILNTWQFSGELKGMNKKDAFTMKFWARKKIDNLLFLLSQFSDNPAMSASLKDEIVEISLEYGILTPFTSYLDPGFQTSIVDEESPIVSLDQLPKDLVLFKNFPNPFNAATSISFQIFSNKIEKSARLEIYNLLGKLILTKSIPVNGPGIYHIVWDGTNIAGQAMPSGVYFYRLQIGAQSKIGKMILLK